MAAPPVVPPTPGTGATPATRTSAPTPVAPAPISPAPSAPAPAGAVPAGAETATLNATQIQSAIAAKLPDHADLAQPLAAKLGTESLTQQQFDGRFRDPAHLYSAMVSEWRAGRADGEFVKAFGQPDPIAVQKFADVDAEAYLEDPTVKDRFWQDVAGALQSTITVRSRVFPVMTAKSYAYSMKGTKIPAAQLTPLQSRNQSVGKLYEATTTGAKDAAKAKAFQMVQAETGATRAQLDAWGIVPDDQQLRAAFREMLRTTHVANPHSLAEASTLLSRYGTWYKPGEMRVSSADPNVAFAEMMTLGALQPEWYPEGTAVLNINRSVDDKLREARKPTAFDGMCSALWMARNQPGQTYGVTGGGVGEFVEKGVTYGEVISSTAAVPAEDFLRALDRLVQTVKSRKAAEGSTVTEEVLRGNGVGGGKSGPMRQVHAMYNQVTERSGQESKRPTAIPENTAPVGPGAAVAGGTFDPTRQTPIH